jgi:hypothetical protein
MCSPRTWYLTGGGGLHLGLGVAQELHKRLDQIFPDDILSHRFGELDKPLGEHVLDPPALIRPTGGQLRPDLFLDLSLGVQAFADGDQVRDGQ